MIVKAGFADAPDDLADVDPIAQHPADEADIPEAGLATGVGMRAHLAVEPAHEGADTPALAAAIKSGSYVARPIRPGCLRL